MSHVLVTGGAGFLGSHLCETLLRRGDKVTCVDNLSSGSNENLAVLERWPAFSFQLRDVCDGITLDEQVDVVAHLASPASPPEYLRMPVQTLRTGSRGTEAALDLANQHGARFVLASTSEVYGEPLVHPQKEDYWGNVNSVGPRSVYDEAKRYAEALTMAYQRSKAANVGIVRIFNTYGPRLRPGDGRVVSNFIVQALAGEPLTVYGDGSQTRSFCYVDDLVRGLIRMLDNEVVGPVNLGNPEEITVNELANLVLRLTESDSPIEWHPIPTDDPTRRRPDIGFAKSVLAWEPTVSSEQGLSKTIAWFRTATHSNLGWT